MSSVVIENKPLQVCVLFALSGLIFPIMTGVLYIIPYISVVKAQLCFVEQKKKKTLNKWLIVNTCGAELKLNTIPVLFKSIVIISYITIRTKNIDMSLVHIAQP